MALFTVIRDVRNFPVSVVSVGILVPGGHWPFKIGSARARLICCQIGPSPSRVGITGSCGECPLVEPFDPECNDFETALLAKVRFTPRANSGSASAREPQSF